MVKEAVLEKVAFDFPLEILKHVEETGEFHIVGYAATTDFDMQGDIITDEALMASSVDLVKNSTVLLNHEIKRPIGKVTKAEFDKHGLLIDVLVSKTEPDIIQKIKEGVLNKFSIRGEVLEREKKYMAEFDRLVNVIKRISLIEVSLVSVPANPEAKAIGWYISKALLKTEDGAAPNIDTGGQSMSEKETTKSADPGEETTQEKNKEEQQPGAQEEQKPPEPEKFPEEKKTEEAGASGLSKTYLSLLSSIIDKLVEIGGDAAPLAGQAKSILKWLAGEDKTPPIVTFPAAKGPSEQEISKKISDEVKKQLEAALKGLPAQRKGIVQPEPAADELKKTFEGLPPEKKLKVALALQQG